MPSSSGDHQEAQPALDLGQPEVELETGPRAERPNFLTATRFVDFDLPPEILEGLDKAGFEYCTPIQAQAIPVAMHGLDIAGQAQTGTGKTTAFLVPLLNRLLKNKPLEPGMPRALIVTPTRELALQIHEDALVLAGATELRQVLVIGGMEYKEQADLLRTNPEIIICTPGRIIDYLQQGVFKTKAIEVAVVDEADRLLDMGFIKDLKYLLGKLPHYTHRQTMLFSATLDDRVLELTYEFMNPPQFITAEPDKDTKVNIEQELYHVGRDEKLSLLLGLLRHEEHRRVIIFVNTKSGVEWLAKKLTLNGFQAEGITGDLPQPKRLKLMEAFKENRLQILVATDVASRGIHVDDVSHVYNYDLPQDAENYVHRIGRTARAGNTGKAVSFGCEDYVFHLEAIENLLGEKIPVFWADQDWFQEDQGGEVHVKGRRGVGDRDRRKGGGGERRGGREGGGRAPRGPAKSQRPGGIFGLSPRITGDETQGVRQSLSWGAPPEPEPILEGEVIEAPAEAAEAVPEQARDGRSDRERDRRRKRRRGRRGRGDAPEGTAREAAPAEDKPEAPAAKPAAPKEAAPKEAPQAAPTEAKPARTSYPTSSRKPRPAAPTTRPEAPAPVPATPTPPPAAEAPAPKVEKPRRAPKPAEPKVAEPKVAAGKVEPKAVPAGAEKAAKPATRKPAARKAAATDEAAPAKPARKAAPKAPKAESVATAAEAPAKKPAAKKPAAKPKADGAGVEAPAEKKPARKKAAAKDAASEAAKAPKKAAARGTGAAAEKKGRTTKKTAPETE